MENVKRLVALWQLLATNTQLSQFVEPQDIEVLKRRTEGEGVAFLTTTLPGLYKSLDAAMQTSRLELPSGFAKCKKHHYPRFLRRAWAAIFNKDGSLKATNEIHPGAVACIRQLSAIYYKLEMPHTDDQIATTQAAFLQTEADLANLDLTSSPQLRGMLKRARRIVSRLLSREDPFDIKPDHGSGASSCRVVPWERYESFRFIQRLHAEYPYDKFFFYNQTHLCDNIDALLDSEDDDPMARVVYVPKDSRGPRLISCEPREFMFIQKGLMAKMYNCVEKQPAIARQIGFTDQTRNQELARIGSLHGTYATLDLKEASDRVSWDLVKTIFPSNWVRALGASRSSATVLTDGTIVPLRKFAPMGSACCFPVETICFWAIAHAAIGDEAQINRAFRNRTLNTDSKISVFGDDIIVPTPEAEVVTQALTDCGLIVNESKSFRRGPFRESCGGDFFNGIDVAPIRLKCLPGDDKRARHRVCDSFNNLIHKYEYANVGLALQLLFEEWYGPVPVSNRHEVRLDERGKTHLSLELDCSQSHKLARAPGMSKAHRGLALYAPYTDVPTQYRKRFNRKLQATEYLICIEAPVNCEVDVDRWSQVLRKELKVLDPWTVSRCAIANRVYYKYSWVSL